MFEILTLTRLQIQSYACSRFRPLITVESKSLEVNIEIIITGRVIHFNCVSSGNFQVLGSLLRFIKILHTALTQIMKHICILSYSSNSMKFNLVLSFIRAISIFFKLWVHSHAYLCCVTHFFLDWDRVVSNFLCVYFLYGGRKLFCSVQTVKWKKTF